MEAVLRAYCELWTETDPDRRANLIAASLHPEAEIVGPGYNLKGHNEVAAEVARFLKSEPGFRLALTSGFDSHHDWVRFSFELLDQEDQSVNRAWDLVQLGADGRIIKVISFWGALPSLPEGWPQKLLPSKRSPEGCE